MVVGPSDVVEDVSGFRVSCRGVAFMAALL